MQSILTTFPAKALLSASVWLLLTHINLAHAQAEITIISSTPLPGVGLDKNQFPTPVQNATAQDVADSGAVDVADFLNRRMGSVFVNEVQGNALMADVSYRGYTASPLLGTPQGLSVYLDGVRLNQPFGDVVMWDLIPKNALSSVTLMPGSNPLFGLNTLGGALALQTKDGRRNPGFSAEATVGSFGRRTLGLEWGGKNDKGLDGYLTTNLYREAGWRDASPSRVGQLFGKLGWRNANTQLSLSYAHGQTRLNGNGLQEEQLLAVRRQSVFTQPDTTRNQAHFFNLAVKHAVNDDLLFSGNAYYRATVTDTTSADLNENALGESVYYTGAAADKTWFASHGYGAPALDGSNSRISATNAFPQLRCIAQAGANTEPNEKCNGLINTTRTAQKNLGLAGQWALQRAGTGWRSQSVWGGAFDASAVQFNQSAQFAYLNADRTLTPVGAFADGTQVSENAFDQRVRLDGRIHNASLFATHTYSLRDQWHTTLSARYNQTQLHNTDTVYPYNNATTLGDQRGSLDGNHRFRRLNPAFGISYVPSAQFNAYLGYAEGSRTPTSIELGCADPAFGCRLPNSMAGDPALKQVVSKTWELGLRGRLSHSVAGTVLWNAGLFRGDNTDEILFVSNSASTGYFKNFGKTRRAGLEAGLSTQTKTWRAGANYTYLRATYESAETVNAHYNSAADANGAIAITPGNRIPLMPAHLLKAHVDVQLQPQWWATLGMVAVGSSFVRGNENNAHIPNNQTALGTGRLPGYAAFNLATHYSPSKSLKLTLQINNLFNRQYATAGQLSPYAIQPSGGYNNSATLGTTALSPGAPRSLAVGARYAFE